MIFDWIRSLFYRNQTNADNKEYLELFNASNERFLIEKEEYRSRVLPHNLAINRDNPQGLYDTIVGALKDDFNEDVLAASERLLEIDTYLERSHCLASIVLMKNAKNIEARDLLNKYIKEHGSSAVILTNLAKTYSDTSIIKDILWQAIALDPNFDNSLDYWLAIIYEQEGNKQRTESLLKVSALQGSWLAQLYLASEYLKENNNAEALSLIEYVLNTAPKESTALYTISGELGKNGLHEEVLRLVLPKLDIEEIFDYGVIHNILQTFYELNMPSEGVRLIDQVRQKIKTKHPVELSRIEDDLKFYEQQFAAMTQEV